MKLQGKLDTSFQSVYFTWYWPLCCSFLTLRQWELYHRLQKSNEFFKWKRRLQRYFSHWLFLVFCSQAPWVFIYFPLKLEYGLLKKKKKASSALGYKAPSTPFTSLHDTILWSKPTLFLKSQVIKLSLVYSWGFPNVSLYIYS